MTHTTDPNDPRIRRFGDPEIGKQNAAYLVLSEEERAKGFVRQVRRTYVHQFMLDGSPVPYPLMSRNGLAGCGVATTMSLPLAETYARDPSFYGATWCCGCGKHLPVSEFTWEDHTEVGS
ncbi:hypothetical protein [Dyella japonica]|uniref:Uncharacterized protein n=1 Tax=Dyella japonica TaxID=231455 RepID=A0ABV2JXB2_9GAMM